MPAPLFTFPANHITTNIDNSQHAILLRMNISWRKLSNQHGFTLIEILVVLSIIGILVSAVMFNMSDSSKKARDSERQADLRNIQSALELYKNKYGRYPEACTPANSTNAQGWSGQPGTNFACQSQVNNYILGNEVEGRLFSEFIPVLPTDPKLNSSTPGTSGYVYRTNANGTVYKLMAMRTVESEKVNYGHPFKSCDIVPVNSNGTGYPDGAGPNDITVAGWCSYVQVSGMSNGPQPHCKMQGDNGNDGRFSNSYGLWGGFEPKNSLGNDALRFRETTTVICR